MRVLITSYVFAPSVGGVETMSESMARTFVLAGHQVTVVTDTPFDETDEYPFRVVRCPSRETLKKLIDATDVVWQNNVSLRLGWPLLFRHRPLVITHNGPQVARNPWKPSVFMQRLLCRRAYNVGASRFMAKLIPGADGAIDNPYGADFGRIAGIERDNDVVFVGRVVSEKGPDVFISALLKLKKSGRQLSATVIGDGALSTALEELSRREKLDVRFTGALAPPEIARELNAHRVLAVPSVWEEPFGIVALEGLACGCRIVASNRGGLPDAAGPGAVLFEITEPADDASADRLAAAIVEALDHPLTAAQETAAAEHLNTHSAVATGGRYLEIFAREIERVRK